MMLFKNVNIGTYKLCNVRYYTCQLTVRRPTDTVQFKHTGPTSNADKTCKSKRICTQCIKQKVIS